MIPCNAVRPVVSEAGCVPRIALCKHAQPESPYCCLLRRLDGTVSDYQKVIDYYHPVEKQSIPFETGECDAKSIGEGRCFVLALPQAVEKYTAAGYRLEPAVYVKQMPVAFQVSRGNPAQSSLDLALRLISRRSPTALSVKSISPS